MHTLLLAAAQKRAWGEGPDLALGDPEALCQEVLPSYRRAVYAAEDGDLLRAAKRALQAYEDAEWRGEQCEAAEDLLEGYAKAIDALTDPLALLDDLFVACDNANESGPFGVGVDDSVWLPSRTSLSRVCQEAILTTEGPKALADTVLGGFKLAFLGSDQRVFAHRALCRVLGNVIRHDTEVVVRAMVEAIQRVHPTSGMPFDMVLAIWSECVNVDASVAADEVFEAYVEVIEFDDDCQVELVDVLVRASKRAVRDAEDPSAATAGMVEALSKALPGGPRTPDWMIPDDSVDHHDTSCGRSRRSDLR